MIEKTIRCKLELVSDAIITVQIRNILTCITHLFLKVIIRTSIHLLIGVFFCCVYLLFTSLMLVYFISIQYEPLNSYIHNVVAFTILIFFNVVILIIVEILLEMIF